MPVRSGYVNAIDLAAGAVLLTAVLIVWRRELRSLVRLLGLQGAALALIPILEGVHRHDAAPIAIGVGVAVLKAGLLPWLLSRAVRDERESTPLVNTAASLLVAAALIITAFAITGPLVNLDPSATTRAAAAGIAVVLLGVFVMVSRRRAISQAVGFLMLDNGIAATAFLITTGVPVVVELGASLDVLFAVLILGVLTGRMRRTIGDTDLDQLRALRDT